METLLPHPKVIVLEANPLVCANVRVLLSSMGYQCLVAPALKEAVELFELEKADAAILDPQEADSSPARVVVAFDKRVPGLRGRSIVLIKEKSDPELLQVLDAYSVPKVRLENLLHEL